MVGTAQSFLQYNTENSMICSFCHKPTNMLTTHHVIPRFLTISSDDDTIEICPSCHRRLDQRWCTFILWGSFNPVGWVNPVKHKARTIAWREANAERVRSYHRRSNEKKKMERRAKGIPPRTPNIRQRYDDLNVFKKQLSYLYWEKNLGWRGVSEEMKLSNSCVMKWVRLLGIPSRPIPIAVHLSYERRKNLW